VSHIKIKNWSILTLVLISILETIYTVNMELAEREIGTSIEILCGFSFALVIAIYAFRYLSININHNYA